MTSSKPSKLREDLRGHFEFVEGTQNESGADLRCLHKDCERKKPRTFTVKQGWSSHASHLVIFSTEWTALHFKNYVRRCSYWFLQKTMHEIDINAKQNKSVPSILSYAVTNGPRKCFSNNNCYPRTNPKQIKFDSNLQDLIALAGLPLQTVDHPAFLNFVKDLDKSVRVCSRRTVTRRFIKGAQKVSFSLKLWDYPSEANSSVIRFQYLVIFTGKNLTEKGAF